MARRGKWLTGISPEVPASEAARQALESRLHLVWRFLPLAAQRAEDDPEYVHQLRVASRRAMAAVKCFAEFAPPRRLNKLARKLKKVRKAAGAARDADVLLAHLREQARQSGEGSWKPVLEIVIQRRHAAQRPIQKVHRRLAADHFGRRIERLLHKVHFRPAPPEATVQSSQGAGSDHLAVAPAANGSRLPAREPTFGEFARTSLSRGVDAFFAAGEQDLHEIQALHAFRIEGKALRYSIELFAGAFAPAMREELYPIVEKMQERLGEVNDHATAIATFGQLKSEAGPRSTDALDRSLAERRAALNHAQHEFLEWWTPLRAQELRRRFDELLGRATATTVGSMVAESPPADASQPPAADSDPGSHARLLRSLAEENGN